MSGDHDNYTESNAIEYVRFLGCWTSPNVRQARKDRTPEEYTRALYNLIKINKTRTDPIGTWETRAAWSALERL
jgi:hypothetical protein